MGGLIFMVAVDRIVIPTTFVVGPFRPAGSNLTLLKQCNVQTDIPTNKN